MSKDIAPITRTMAMTMAEWRLRLAELCRDCASAESEDEGDLLLKTYGLIAKAPQVQSGLHDHLPPMSTMQALVKLGAHDSAALALMPENASYILSRSIDGDCLASVILPDMDEEMTSEAQTPALSLLSALAACLASAAQGADPTATVGIGKSGRAWRSDLALDVEEWRVPDSAVLH
jgi:hypothetical protein